MFGNPSKIVQTRTLLDNYAQFLGVYAKCATRLLKEAFSEFLV
jgi:hypothetical protein